MDYKPGEMAKEAWEILYFDLCLDREINLAQREGVIEWIKKEILFSDEEYKDCKTRLQKLDKKARDIDDRLEYLRTYNIRER